MVLTRAVLELVAAFFVAAVLAGAWLLRREARRNRQSDERWSSFWQPDVPSPPP